MAPVLSTASNNTIEICTAFGLVKMAVADEPASSEHSDQPGHCVFCNLRELALLPPQAPTPLPSGFFSSVAVSAFEIRLAGLQSFRSYNPRAPPSILS